MHQIMIIFLYSIPQKILFLIAISKITTKKRAARHSTEQTLEFSKHSRSKYLKD